ncbi:MAG: UvrD-helicase domain-containing protein [Castellaniella sp.]|uniref:UvrD-helicase domain-containing protein n=1 Tax=Castellaniella sp. TaxID=1955812 RepID=UPI002A370394|nr:UvrD-helicase domain-containing protein [Castellaniella sp.]MDY0309067.1 UvrD-helicase domain-containing protein [Castellaniella sp.]
MAPGSTLPQDLNARQREAVLYLDGPCLVLAGAGSGKTRVITQKMAYLLRECGYQARHVVALTFTNKAAREMSERVRTLVDPRLLRGLTVGTFHSLGLRFLREEYAGAGLKRGFSILDATDAQGIVQELLATTDRARLRAVQQTISLWKNALLDPDGAAQVAQGPDQAEAVRVYRSYEATLRAYQSVDFDDLIRLPAQMLAADASLRARWQARVQYLLVDEYQDTNACQYQLVRMLCGDRAMFTAVGDDDQAIYAWRGATVENLAQLGRDYPTLRLIKLEQNYRSVQRILEAANQVISHNPKTFDKTLWSELGAGEPIVVTPMDSDLAEAESIAMRLSAARFERQAQWKDFAVLYRGNHQARVMEQALRNLRIPYTVSGGQSFFDKAEIRDVLAWLRLIANEDEDPAFIRAVTTPRRGIGQGTLQALGAEAARRGVSLYAVAADVSEAVLPAGRQREAVQQFVRLVDHFRTRAARRGGAVPPLPDADVQGDLLAFDPDPPASGADVVSTAHPADGAAPAGLAGAAVGIDGLRGDDAGRVLDDLLAAMDYERHLYDTLDERQAQSRWANVLELLDWLKRKADEDDMTLLELVQHVALVTMLERADDEEPDAVKLSTLHASKGLEYPHVYLIGVEEGLLPHRGGEDDGDVGEAADAARARRIEEERRLMYVGITRAQRTLRVSWCRKRRRGREDTISEPSRFIAEMGLQAEASHPVGDTDPARTLDRLKALLKR